MPTSPDQPKNAPVDETIKETFESIVIALILAFVFRAYVVEAFVIPTGSMAPTLLGSHLRVTCQDCGYGFATDWPDRNGPDRRISTALARNETTQCPMCQFGNKIQAKTLPSAGDRILVQKYVYSLPAMSPRRWDVVVFKAPHKPDENYIKRLVGLPNEAIMVIEGNIYVAPLTSNGQIGLWRIARKTDEQENTHGYKVQQAAWQPVYHSTYVPLNGVKRGWKVPWMVADGSTGLWEGLDSKTGAERTYRHDGRGRGLIRFDFALAAEDKAGLFPYNHLKGRPPSWVHDPDKLRIEDVRIAADFQPLEQGLSLEIQTTARIDESNRPVLLAGRIGADGQASIGKYEAFDKYQAFDEISVDSFVENRIRKIELWFVDQELILWVDDIPILSKQFDIPVENVRLRPMLEEKDRWPRIAVAAENAAVAIHRVKVDRDTYYISKQNGRGTIWKIGPKNHYGEPFQIKADQFFCMGDNSPESLDSRSWDKQDPRSDYDTWTWVESRKFTDPSKAQAGVVPRRLMMGRAFFVYFPAAYRISPTNLAVFPNFGQMRLIR